MNARNNAAMANPALTFFKAWVGEWTTTGTHPQLPGVLLHGHTSIQWTEGGAFVVIRSEIQHESFPDGIALVGSDNVLGTYFMLYFDERGVSRKQDVAVEGTVLQWWRNAPGFSQRYTLTLMDNGNTIIGKGELSTDDLTWENDLDLTYTRRK